CIAIEVGTSIGQTCRQPLTIVLPNEHIAYEWSHNIYHCSLDYSPTQNSTPQPMHTCSHKAPSTIPLTDHVYHPHNLHHLIAWRYIGRDKTFRFILIPLIVT